MIKKLCDFYFVEKEKNRESERADFMVIYGCKVC